MDIIKASLMMACGGGGGANVAPKPDTVVRNGTYYARDDNLDGYTQFDVSIPIPTITQIGISENGRYEAAEYGVDGWDVVSVNVQFHTDKPSEDLTEHVPEEFEFVNKSLTWYSKNYPPKSDQSDYTIEFKGDTYTFKCGIFTYLYLNGQPEAAIPRTFGAANGYVYGSVSNIEVIPASQSQSGKAEFHCNYNYKTNTFPSGTSQPMNYIFDSGVNVDYQSDSTGFDFRPRE